MPNTRLTLPGGAPASTKARTSSAQEAGVSSAPLTMMAQPAASALAPDGPATAEGTFRYAGEARLGRPGPFGYTVRVVPCHPLLDSTAELGLVTYPDAPEGMTNGDLR